MLKILVKMNFMAINLELPQIDLSDGQLRGELCRMCFMFSLGCPMLVFLGPFLEFQLYS